MSEKFEKSLSAQEEQEVPPIESSEGEERLQKRLRALNSRIENIQSRMDNLLDEYGVSVYPNNEREFNALIEKLNDARREEEDVRESLRVQELRQEKEGNHEIAAKEEVKRKAEEAITRERKTILNSFKTNTMRGLRMLAASAILTGAFSLDAMMYGWPAKPTFSKEYIAESFDRAQRYFTSAREFEEKVEKELGGVEIINKNEEKITPPMNNKRFPTANASHAEIQNIRAAFKNLPSHFSEATPEKLRIEAFTHETEEILRIKYDIFLSYKERFTERIPSFTEFKNEMQEKGFYETWLEGKPLKIYIADVSTKEYSDMAKRIFAAQVGIRGEAPQAETMPYGVCVCHRNPDGSYEQSIIFPEHLLRFPGKPLLPRIENIKLGGQVPFPLIKSFDQTVAIEGLIAHEGTHRVTGALLDEEKLNKKFFEAMEIEDWTKFQEKYKYMISSKGEPNELLKSFMKARLNYGMNHLREFYAVGTEFYLRGEDYFLAIYTPMLGEEKAKKFYDFMRDEIFMEHHYKNAPSTKKER